MLPIHVMAQLVSQNSKWSAVDDIARIAPLSSGGPDSGAHSRPNINLSISVISANAKRAFADTVNFNHGRRDTIFLAPLDNPDFAVE